MIFKNLLHKKYLNNREELLLASISIISLLLLLFVANPTILPWKYTHFLFSYEDGFIKRGLVGEVINLFNIDTTYQFHIQVSYLALLISIVLFGTFISLTIKKNKSHTGAWLFFIIAITHSGTIQHFYYDLGRFDIFNIIIILTLFLLYFKNKYVFLAFSIPLLSITILIHEASYLVSIPLVFGLWIYDHGFKRYYVYILLCFVFFTFITYIVSKHGTLTQGEIAYFYDQLLNDFPKDNVSIASINVLKRDTIWSNFEHTFNKSFNIRGHIQLLIFLIPNVLLFFKVLRKNYLNNGNFYYQVVFIISSFSPLLLYPLGIDHFRWWALSITNLFIALSYIYYTDEYFAKILSDTLFNNRALTFIVIINNLLAGPLMHFEAFQRM